MLFGVRLCVLKVALTDIREAEIRIDLMILPVEEAYVMLNKYQLTFNDGNAERVDTISYSWKLLKQQVSASFCYSTAFCISWFSRLAKALVR